MGLIELIVTIAVVGLMVWAITTLIPMPDVYKRAIIVISVIGLVFFILGALGVMPHIAQIRVGR